MARSALMCSNIYTAKIANKTHHCEECNTMATRICLKKLHVSYCEAPVDNKVGRCGARFNVKSRGGCSTHPYSEGWNRAVVLERKGLNPDFKTDYETELEAREKAAGETAAAAAAEKVVERPYNTDWSHPGYKEKSPRKEKKNDKQGKKLPIAKDISTILKEKKKKNADD